MVFWLVRMLLKAKEQLFVTEETRPGPRVKTQTVLRLKRVAGHRGPVFATSPAHAPEISVRSNQKRLVKEKSLLMKNRLGFCAPATFALGFFVVLAAGGSARAQVANSNAGQNAGQSDASQRQDEDILTGTVVSSTRNTLVVRRDNGTYQLFTFDTNTVRPASLTGGTRVRVESSASDDPGYRIAHSINTLTAGQSASAAAGNANVVPPAIRGLERDIERQARRYRVGFRAGVALDPEVLVVGVQGQIGPIFRSNISFRPNVEFGFGEVTALFALNPEFIYRLPVSSAQGRWSAYLGAGPGFTFLHQNFDRTTGEGRRVDFGEFHSSTGLNILGGIQHRRGTFVELKTSVYAAPAPTLRLIFGYNF